MLFQAGRTFATQCADFANQFAMRVVRAPRTVDENSKACAHIEHSVTDLSDLSPIGCRLLFKARQTIPHFAGIGATLNMRAVHSQTIPCSASSRVTWRIASSTATAFSG